MTLWNCVYCVHRSELACAASQGRILCCDTILLPGRAHDAQLAGTWGQVERAGRTDGKERIALGGDSVAGAPGASKSVQRPAAPDVKISVTAVGPREHLLTATLRPSDVQQRAFCCSAPKNKCQKNVRQGTSTVV